MEWLEELETRVHEAAERLRELREENQSLQERVDELEMKLAAAVPTNLDAAEGSELAGAREENDALREQIADLELKLARAEEVASREHEEIRGRVERLTRHLEELVG
jgi:chromosome segregation ATPase